MIEISNDKGLDLFKQESFVYVIAYDSAFNRPTGMIATFNMKCSTDPEMLAVALWIKGYTHKVISKEKEFVISVPSKEMEQHVPVFGKLHGDKVNKFEQTKIPYTKSKFIKAPLLSEAVLNFECKLIKEISFGGDHILFIGKVLASYFNEGKDILIDIS